MTTLAASLKLQRPPAAAGAAEAPTAVAATTLCNRSSNRSCQQPETGTRRRSGYHPPLKSQSPPAVRSTQPQRPPTAAGTASVHRQHRRCLRPPALHDQPDNLGTYPVFVQRTEDTAEARFISRPRKIPFWGREGGRRGRREEDCWFVWLVEWPIYVLILLGSRSLELV